MAFAALFLGVAVTLFFLVFRQLRHFWRRVMTLASLFFMCISALLVCGRGSGYIVLAWRCQYRFWVWQWLNSFWRLSGFVVFGHVIAGIIFRSASISIYYVWAAQPLNEEIGVTQLCIARIFLVVYHLILIFWGLCERSMVFHLSIFTLALFIHFSPIGAIEGLFLCHL